MLEFQQNSQSCLVQEQLVYLGRASLGASVYSMGWQGWEYCRDQPHPRPPPRRNCVIPGADIISGSAGRLPGQGKSQGTSQGFPCIPLYPILLLQRPHMGRAALPLGRSLQGWKTHIPPIPNPLGFQAMDEQSPNSISSWALL